MDKEKLNYHNSTPFQRAMLEQLEAINKSLTLIVERIGYAVECNCNGVNRDACPTCTPRMQEIPY